MESLRRVQAGEYTIEQSVPLATLLETADPGQYLRTVDTMFRNYPAVTLTAKQELRCRNGNGFSIALADGKYRAYGENGEFLMLAQVDGGTMSTIKSFFEV
jgi:tRNA U55 pseudouridine synthase TruB